MNFATPIAFWIAFNCVGAKLAIGIAVGVSVSQTLVHRLRGIRFSPIFIVATGFTVFFGVIDLCLQDPCFFRLEPFLQNFLIGAGLTLTLAKRIPVAAWFASALPERMRPPLTPETEGYLRKLTAIWTSYFYLKSLLFLYLAYQVDLDDLVILRTILGGGSLLVMIFGERLYRKYAFTLT